MGDELPRDGGIVVAGAGECGTHAAFALREHGWSGPITILGSEPIDAYERPPLSKASLLGDSCDPVHPYPAASFAEAGITVLRSTDVDRIVPEEHQVEAGGERLAYDKLLLTVGASPRRLPFPGELGLLYLRTHEDALRIRAELEPGRRIGIVGAGFIGLELAASASSRGSQVLVIEGAGQALGRAVPASVAQEAAALHQAHGVQFRFGTTVTSARRTGSRLQLTLSTGQHESFDAVIAGIGAAPNVALAAAAGLTVDNGIAVDEFLRTSHEDVFAAGDCASFPHPLFGGSRVRLESWRNALDQAATVAANLMGGSRPHDTVPWFWSDQYDHSLQVAGLSVLAARFVSRTRADGVSVTFGLDGHDRLVCASAFGPGNTVARDIRLASTMLRIGAHPAPAQLQDPGVPLRKILQEATAAA